MRTACFAALISVLSFVSAARADVLAYTSAATTAGNQNWGYNLGLQFTTTSDIRIDSLGLYSSNVAGGGSGFSGTDFATLFNSSGAVVAQLEFGGGTGNGTLVAGTSDYLKPLATPITLLSGFTGTISAFYGSGTDQTNNNANFPAETGLSSLTYNGTSPYDNGGTKNTFPITPGGGPANRYNAATFSFANVPEPASFVLCGLGAIGLFIAARRNRKA